MIDHLAYASLNDEECPPTAELTAYVMNQLDGAAQLRVAAHVRGCPLCQFLVAATRPAEIITAGDAMWVPARRRRGPAARALPLPLLSGRRGSSTQAGLQHYAQGAISIELTISPPDGDSWRISGQVLHHDEPLAEASVLLRAGRRSYRQQSDPLGFFSFTNLPPGTYRLQLSHGELHAEIRAITLSNDLP
jgi:hypothetical protein